MQLFGKMEALCSENETKRNETTNLQRANSLMKIMHRTNHIIFVDALLNVNYQNKPLCK